MPMNQILGQSALIGFVLALAVHVCVLLGIDVAGRLPFVWILEIGLFVLFTPLIVSFVGAIGGKPSLARNRGAVPTWVVTIGLGLLAYAFFDFAYFVYCAMRDDNPELGGGRLLQVYQGQAFHIVALQKYTALRGTVLRALSGNWLFFYFVAFACFTYREKSPPAGEAEMRED
jgi:hypothetical protein